MSKGLGETIRTFGQNCVTHAKRVFSGREGLKDALDDIAIDAKKLGKVVQHGVRPEERAKAQDFTSRGRKHYNQKNYTRAENYFRSAMKHDPTYALPVTYLGHTLYHLGQHDEAVQMWRKAIMTDPKSEAAEKAEAKLRKIEGRTAEAIHHLEKRGDS